MIEAERSLQPEDFEFNFEGLPSGALSAKEVTPTYLEVENPGDGFETIYANHSVTGHGGPKELPTILDKRESEGKFTEQYTGEDYEEEDLTQAINHIRNRFTISENPYVVISPGGSDEILERLIWTIPNPPTRTHIAVLGPCFPNFISFARRLRGTTRDSSFITFGPSEGTREGGLYTPMEDRALQTINEIKSKKVKPLKNDRQRMERILYATNPNSTTGKYLKPAIIDAMAMECYLNGWTFVLDESIADLVSDDDSAIKLTEEYENLVVLRTLSKGLGMPKLKTGYAVMSPEMGEKYNSVRRPLDNADPKLDILNEILDPTILRDHLKKVRYEVELNKLQLLEGGLPHLDTDPYTNVMTIDGGTLDFCKVALDHGVVLAPGSTFSLTHSEMTDQFGRLTTPPKEKIEETITRLKQAIHSANSLT